jgi:hypothetical protein
VKNILLFSKTFVKVLFTLFFLSCLTAGCSKKKGCMYPGAVNYDSSAEEEDGSCKIPGCMNPAAPNYNPYANLDDGSCQLAGLGGNTTIVAKPQHHGAAIYSQSNYPDTAYVKFNTQEFPGWNPSSYDALFAGAQGADHVTIAGLKTGQYYIWMAGFDTTIAERVTGGLPVTLTQSSGIVEQVIPVTE